MTMTRKIMACAKSIFAIAATIVALVACVSCAFWAKAAELAQESAMMVKAIAKIDFACAIILRAMVTAMLLMACRQR